jgi:hypothetical protein
MRYHPLPIWEVENNYAGQQEAIVVWEVPMGIFANFPAEYIASHHFYSFLPG